MELSGTDWNWLELSGSKWSWLKLSGTKVELTISGPQWNGLELNGAELWIELSETERTQGNWAELELGELHFFLYFNIIIAMFAGKVHAFCE